MSKQLRVGPKADGHDALLQHAIDEQRSCVEEDGVARNEGVSERSGDVLETVMVGEAHQLSHGAAQNSMRSLKVIAIFNPYFPTCIIGRQESGGWEPCP